MTSVRPVLAGEPQREPEVEDVADQQPDPERGQDRLVDVAAADPDHADREPGEDEHVDQHVDPEAEEGVQVAAGPERPAGLEGIARQSTWVGSGQLGDGKDGEELGRRRDPAEDAALGGDHAEPHLVELREVGAGAVRQHQALEAAVVGLADGGVHAHLGGDAADDQARDPVVAEDQLEVGRVERALAGLVEHDLARQRRDRVDDVVALLPADEDAALGALGADRRARAGRGRASRAARRRGRGGGPRACGRRACPPRARRRARRGWARPRAGAGRTSLPSSSPKPPGSRKSRCRSMMSSAVVGGRERERVRLGRQGDLRRCVEVHQRPFSERAVYNAVDECPLRLGCDAISGSVGRYSGPGVPKSRRDRSTRGPRSARTGLDVGFRLMHTSLYADTAVERLAAARPLLVDVLPAREVVPRLAAGGVMPRRPADRVRGHVRADARGAGGRARARGRRAPTPADALALADAGERRPAPQPRRRAASGR